MPLQADLKVTGQLANALGLAMHTASDMAEALWIMRSNDFDVFLFNCEVSVGSISQRDPKTLRLVRASAWLVAVYSVR